MITHEPLDIPGSSSDLTGKPGYKHLDVGLMKPGEITDDQMGRALTGKSESEQVEKTVNEMVDKLRDLRGRDD